MAELEEFTLPKYGTLESSRLRSKKAYDLVNLVSIKFGASITWNNASRFNTINRVLKPSIFFRFHGNKFMPYLEFLSDDLGVLREIKESFPANFVGDVEIKGGLL